MNKNTKTSLAIMALAFTYLYTTDASASTRDTRSMRRETVLRMREKAPELHRGQSARPNLSAQNANDTRGATTELNVSASESVIKKLAEQMVPKKQSAVQLSEQETLRSLEGSEENDISAKIEELERAFDD